MESGIFRLRPSEDGEIGCERMHAVAFPRPAMRFNDGRTDRAGRLWTSSMLMDSSLGMAAGGLYRCDAQAGLSAPLLSGLVVGNGLAFSPDGRTMYLSDSHVSVQRVWAFDLDEAGTPSNRRPFVDFRPLDGRPDGAAVDVEGGYWICANDGGAVLRFSPEGRLDRKIDLPVAKPSMCAFGGPQLDRLFIASITPASPVAGYDPALAGAVLVADAGIAGIAETPYGGQPR
jgi:sugar lactone lactonase YvrE